jgi:hypothetical protein
LPHWMCIVLLHLAFYFSFCFFPLYQTRATVSSTSYWEDSTCFFCLFLLFLPPLKTAPMLAESNGSPYAGDAPKLRTACENCRQSKVKCNLSGKSVCTRCLRHGLQCQYGFANRSGKPKGSKNRATLRKLGQLQEEKPAMRGFRSSRLVAPVAEMEPLGSAYGNHIADPEIDDEVSISPILSGTFLTMIHYRSV